MKRMKSAVWMSYDLGVRGDYESLFTWLDEREARECGDGVAFLTYEHQGDLVSSLKRALKGRIDLGRRDRLYVIYRDPKTSKLKGTFLFGGRKAAPWSGHAARQTVPDVDLS